MFRFIAFSILTFLISTQANAQSESTFRSVAVPGWGQFYNQQPLKGWAIIGVEAVSIASWFYFDDLKTSKYNDYLLSTDPQRTESLYEDVEKYRDLKRYSLIAISSVWILNIADAWYFYDEEEHLASGKSRIDLNFKDNTMLISFRMNFNIQGGK